MNDIVLRLFTDYVVPVLGSAILVVGGYGIMLLNKKLKNEQVKHALSQLSIITKSVVENLNQTMVPMFKEKAADGKLSQEDIQALKNKALVMIKSQMQDEFLDLLAKNTIDVEQRISTEIESQVIRAKICSNGK